MPEKPVPPVSEEVHLPGGSIQPILVTLGVTITLLGVTFSPFVVAFGLILTIATVIRWIMDTKRDIDALPSHSDHH